MTHITLRDLTGCVVRPAVHIQTGQQQQQRGVLGTARVFITPAVYGCDRDIMSPKNGLRYQPDVLQRKPHMVTS
jgi:hypothetical protein